jgi:hypothetical protein
LKELNYINASYGQIFWDQDNVIICGIHENDGNYSPEYMGILFTHFGIKVNEYKSIPEFIKQWNGYDNFY